MNSTTPQTNTKNGIRLENLDTSLRPQDDFYQFATGGWQRLHPLEKEYACFGASNLLSLTNLQQINDLVQDIVANQTSPHADAASDADQQKISDLYHLYMDADRREREGIQPILSILEEIDSIPHKDMLSERLGRSMNYGLWAFYVAPDQRQSDRNILHEAQSGYTLERNDYLDDDPRSLSLREAYRHYIIELLSLYGICHHQETIADHILRMETRIAKAAKSREELRDPIANYHMMTVQELQQLVPQIDWQTHLTAAGISTDFLTIGQLEHLQEMGRFLEEEPLENLKWLFKWQVMDEASVYLTSQLYDASFRFYGTILTGKEEPRPMWKRAMGIIQGFFGEAIGRMYVERYFPEACKVRVHALVSNLIDAFSQRIQSQEWMSQTTKEQALRKLQAMTVKIGYPDTWRDYSQLIIDSSLPLYQNIQRAILFQRNYSLSYLNQPVDKTQWYMLPQSVNAYYNPSGNEICFPAGILQYPFFDMEADDAFCYGAIGVIIGHEMTHGFDDNGCQFDPQGNLANWWNDEDKKLFASHTEKMKDYFCQLEVAPGVNANGILTLGENIADHGGLQISFLAFQEAMQEKGKDVFTSDGEVYTPAQRFFLSYANVWACNIREKEVLLRTKSDTHSLNRWRVNGALPHIDAWYKAWDVRPSDALYLAPTQRVSIW